MNLQPEENGLTTSEQVVSPNVRRMKLVIEYEGTNFSGWQFQPQRRTVQGDLESALERTVGDACKVYGAGRTDAGVHARGQVAHINLVDSRLTPRQIIGALNSRTGRDLFVLSAEEVDAEFHARYDAKSRFYYYNLLNAPYPTLRRFGWCPKLDWDNEKIKLFIPYLLGEHCFKSFCRECPGEERYRCEIQKIQWTQTDWGARFEIAANRFFHQLVRGLVGSLFDLGRGYLSEEDYQELLDHPVEHAVVTFAQPQGLTLEKVVY